MRRAQRNIPLLAALTLALALIAGDRADGKPRAATAVAPAERCVRDKGFGPRCRFVEEVRAPGQLEPQRPFEHVYSELESDFAFVRGLLKPGDPGFRQLSDAAQIDPSFPRKKFLSDLRYAVRHFELAVAAIPTRRAPGDSDFERAHDRAQAIYQKLQFIVFAYRETLERNPGMKAPATTWIEDHFARATTELVRAYKGTQSSRSDKRPR